VSAVESSMVSDGARCMWCGRGYPPAKPSQEHVLPDYLGVSVTLPEDMVCQDCNHLLNREVDQPFRDSLRFFSALVGVHASKRPGGGTADVVVQTNVGPLPARLSQGVLTFAPGRVMPGPEPGMRLFVGTPAEKEALLARLRQDHAVREISSGVVDIQGFSGRYKVHGELLRRAVLKAGINLLALKRPDLLVANAVKTAMRFVLDSNGTEPDLLCAAEEAFGRNRVDPNALQPHHVVNVEAQPGGDCWSRFFLFGGDDIAAGVRLTETWDGPPFLVEETFTARRKRPTTP